MRANCEECGLVRRLSDLVAVPGNGTLTMKVVCRDHIGVEEE